jgi:uncharacterized protein
VAAPHDPDSELPIKLGPCSNGEYLPQPLGEVENEAIRRTRAAAETYARRLNVDRRSFLRSLGGAALMLATISACHEESRAVKGRSVGGRFGLLADAPTEPEAASEALSGNEFILDVQTHFLEYDANHQAGGTFALAFPQAQCSTTDPLGCFSIEQYLEELFLLSDTSMAVISAVPIPGGASPLSIDQMEKAQRTFQAVCDDERLLLHGGAFPQLESIAATREGMRSLEEVHRIAAWKVYTHIPGRWWLDDHEAGVPQVGDAFLDAVAASRSKICCVHKGFGNLFGAGAVEYASPVDVGPAARSHPGVTFVVYHSGYEPEHIEGPYTEETANVGVNRLITTLRSSRIGASGNVYAELGSTWRNVMRDPTQAAHVLGKLLKVLGPERVVWGTDSIWYGAPQDQIQAFRAFEITPECQDRFGYPALTAAVKRKILGANAARIYRVKTQRRTCQFTAEDIQRAREAIPAANRTHGPTNVAELRALIQAHGPV